MWNPITWYKLKRDWRLVSTLEAYFEYSDMPDKRDDVVYYLFENGVGERKVKHDGSGIIHGPFKKATRESHQYYLKRIRPWVEGRYDPDIPSYESIKAKEFKDNLAGYIT